MRDRVILDTGPLVAFLNRRDNYHDWTRRQWAEIRPPLLTCETVLSEACFLVRDLAGGNQAVLGLLQRKVLHIPFRLAESTGEISWLLKKYTDIPMSLADACLVRMAELYPGSPVLTLDRDFTIYRKNRRERIPLLAPPDFK
jgi:uncharacterized protein